VASEPELVQMIMNSRLHFKRIVTGAGALYAMLFSALAKRACQGLPCVLAKRTNMNATGQKMSKLERTGRLAVYAVWLRKTNGGIFQIVAKNGGDDRDRSSS